MNRWKINQPDDTARADLAGRTDLSPLCCDVLAARGIGSAEDAANFLQGEALSDPFLMQDMQAAVDVITEAVEAGEKICVYGDYDCDGITASMILCDYLDCMGADVMSYIPERAEGYGLNCAAIDTISAQGVTLIITVDNGISAVQEAAYMKEKGIKLVITDHHQPPEVLPEALAVVNPHRADCPSPYKDFCGAGVAFKLCAALDGGDFAAVEEQYADIAAIGTIADVMPLTGENRTLVRKGLAYLKNTENAGLRALAEAAGVNLETINAIGLAFGIVPRLNAAGRFGSPKLAYELLRLDDEQTEDRVQEIMQLNTKRREAEQQVLMEIVQQVRENPQMLHNRVLVFSGKGWHHGVIGIVSARVMETFGKPNLILSTEDGVTARGSGRSLPGFSMYKCLRACGDLLERYGGHECAGGLSLNCENIPAFIQRANEYAREEVPVMPVVTFTADKILRAADFALEQVESLRVLEPFGEGNPIPRFAVLGARIERVSALSQGKHTKLDFSYDGTRQSALIFGKSPQAVGFTAGEYADMLVELSVNDYHGKRSVTVRALDYRHSGVKQEPFLAANACYEDFLRGEEISPAMLARVIPNRGELVALYQYLAQVKTSSVQRLFELYAAKQNGMNYCKLRICLDAFVQAGLAEFDAAATKISMLPATKKVDLQSTAVLSRLRELQNAAQASAAN